MVFVPRHHLMQARTQKYLPPTKGETRRTPQPVRMFPVSLTPGRGSERKPRAAEEAGRARKVLGLFI